MSFLTQALLTPFLGGGARSAPWTNSAESRSVPRGKPKIRAKLGLLGSGIDRTCPNPSASETRNGMNLLP